MSGVLSFVMALHSAVEPPSEWIEPATGHRVVRLSTEPGTSSFYFHQNGFTATGDKLVLSTRRGLAVLDWKSREIKLSFVYFAYCVYFNSLLE